MCIDNVTYKITLEHQDRFDKSRARFCFCPNVYIVFVFSRLFYSNRLNRDTSLLCHLQNAGRYICLAIDKMDDAYGLNTNIKLM